MTHVGYDLDPNKYHQSKHLHLPTTQITLQQVFTSLNSPKYSTAVYYSWQTNTIGSQVNTISSFTPHQPISDTTNTLDIQMMTISNIFQIFLDLPRSIQTFHLTPKSVIPTTQFTKTFKTDYPTKQSKQ